MQSITLIKEVPENEAILKLRKRLETELKVAITIQVLEAYLAGMLETDQYKEFDNIIHRLFMQGYTPGNE